MHLSIIQRRLLHEIHKNVIIELSQFSWLCSTTKRTMQKKSIYIIQYELTLPVNKVIEQFLVRKQQKSHRSSQKTKRSNQFTHRSVIICLKHYVAGNPQTIYFLLWLNKKLLAINSYITEHIDVFLIWHIWHVGTNYLLPMVIKDNEYQSEVDIKLANLGNYIELRSYFLLISKCSVNSQNSHKMPVKCGLWALIYNFYLGNVKVISNANAYMNGRSLYVV